MVSLPGVMAQAVTKQIAVMDDNQFDQKLQPLSKTKAFSVIASGIIDQTSLDAVGKQLKDAGIGKDWSMPLTNLAIKAAVRAITKRIITRGISGPSF